MNHSTFSLLETQLPASALTPLQLPETLLEPAFLLRHFQPRSYTTNQKTQQGKRSLRKFERESEHRSEKRTPQKQEDHVRFKAGLCVRGNTSFPSGRRQKRCSAPSQNQAMHLGVSRHNPQNFSGEWELQQLLSTAPLPGKQCVHFQNDRIPVAGFSRIKSSILSKHKALLAANT